MPLVLVVDDAPDNRILASAVLRGMLGDSFEVRTCGTWGTALEILGGRRPAVIVLDLEMPGRSGLDILGEIRASATLRDVPVLLWSARIAGAGDAPRHGFDAELPKPLDSDERLQTFAYGVERWAVTGRRTRDGGALAPAPAPAPGQPRAP
jgi:CheY-like chemotaxis protein